MLLSSLSEVLSLASVIPFISVLDDPSTVAESHLGISFMQVFSISSEAHLL